MDALLSLSEFNSLKPIASPLDSLPSVFFHTELLTHTNKSSQDPEYLRQAALEVINNIPIEATLIYTDGSKNEIGHTGTTMPQAYVEPLTYLELYSRRKALVNISWRHPPAHSWCCSEGPGAAICFKGDRKDQTALARLSSGHLKPTDSLVVIRSSISAQSAT
ncbi:hypothetical protein AVEN_254449-1 [Araneus ventricosus]|uniref:RNase H type-1 domain-containing protein n=1 Tax=Araneus ventricosus TaxID=182803 RepID=A0A4Y2GL56_ARAVE|nr:hypothetical protein AVEN_27342-1 [Araneus ventricosus]GBM84322.1 hypothetical protein AVEN_254449-1 [Araneus ventricosus]